MGKSNNTAAAVGQVAARGTGTAPVQDGTPEGGQGCEAVPTRSIRAVRGYASGKDDYLARLKKIEGQVRGLQRMVEEDRWCPDIVTQVASATRALQEVAVGLLNDHLHHCVLVAARAPDGNADRLLDEVAGVIRQVTRL